MKGQILFYPSLLFNKPKHEFKPKHLILFYFLIKNLIIIAVRDEN